MSFKNTLLSLICLLLLLFTSGCIYRYHLTHRAVPDYTKDVYLNGLSAQVKIIRDSFAMPHVYATSETDLYKTVGYLTAQDRFWQMDLLRRVTSGQVSEIVGEKAIPMDLLMRSLELTKKSENIIKSSNKELIQSLQAYADGVNQYLNDYKDNLPQEFTLLGYQPEKWEIIHSLNLIGYMAWDLTPNYKAEIILEKIRQKTGSENLQYFVPEHNDKKTTVYPGFELDSDTYNALGILDHYDKIIQELGLTIFSASNNWSVSGRRTASGKPILANDMHLKLSLPSIWYPMHQVVEGKVNVTGVVLPGQPLVVSGHNEDIAWGITNVSVDNIDLYDEKISPTDTTAYFYNDTLRSIRFEKQTLKLKKDKSIEKTIRFTHHGPIISDFVSTGKTKNISMKWVGSHITSNEYQTIYLLNRAKNWNDLREAASYFGAVSQNINYADVKGNIGLQCAAGIPIRKNGTPYAISPGWTDSTEWIGYVPFAQLPFEYNPERGYVASANNRTVDNDYPYYVGCWFSPDYRINRINELLDTNNITVDYMQNVQNDFKSNMAQSVLTILLDVIDSSEQSFNQNEMAIIELIRDWDFYLDKNSKEALIFSQFIIDYMKTGLEDDLGDSLYDEFSGNNLLSSAVFEVAWYNDSWPYHDNKYTEDIEDHRDHILSAFHKAIENLYTLHGKKLRKWDYGKNHQLTIKHPVGEVKIVNWYIGYNKGPFNMGGGKNTVSPFHYSINEPTKVTHGASQRHIYSLGDWDSSKTIIPGGISGHSSSKYYDDQLKYYINGNYKRDLYTKKSIEMNAVSRTTFSSK